jgi:cysteinyl-tRNA synthetase
MKLYNTLSGQSEDLNPTGDTVTMYVCGITPYSTAHVGHAMRAVVFDVLRRYIQHTGLSVRHVENFTDIDDKMIDGAAKAGIPVSELAESNIVTYLSEMDHLNILRADEYPRATSEIDKIVEMIAGLVEKDYAYASGGDVYFRVRADEDYGKLSHRDIDKLLSGARVAVNEEKEDALDFALWKSQKPGEPAWESPWGPGRPGWHIECSAMALEYLGETIDIHGGGQDLVFPHHENELAQSESFTGKVPFAGHWVHNGLVRLGEDKMSKSLGNMVTIGQALETHSCDALRLFFLSSHYRAPLTYTEENVAAQERAAERLRSAATFSSVYVSGAR